MRRALIVAITVEVSLLRPELPEGRRWLVLAAEVVVTEARRQPVSVWAVRPNHVGRYQLRWTRLQLVRWDSRKDHGHQSTSQVLTADYSDPATRSSKSAACRAQTAASRACARESRLRTSIMLSDPAPRASNALARDVKSSAGPSFGLGCGLTARREPRTLASGSTRHATLPRRRSRPRSRTSSRS